MSDSTVQQMTYYNQDPTVELPNLVDQFHSQEVDQNSADKFQGEIEEGDAESAETELEGHDKGKEMHYEDFGKQKPDQNEDSSEQMLEKEVVDETKAPTEVKFASQMEGAEKVEQEPPKSCILVMSSTPPSVTLNEEKASQLELWDNVI
ncbi:hypothetical protein ACLOJK_029503 [Asimina triloba]